MPPFLKDILGSLIRTGLLPILALLAAKGWIVEGQYEKILATVIPLILALIWSIANKYKFDEKINKALDFCTGATRDEFEQALKDKSNGTTSLDL